VLGEHRKVDAAVTCEGTHWLVTAFVEDFG
jgi:hypothetical protein